MVLLTADFKPVPLCRLIKGQETGMLMKGSRDGLSLHPSKVSLVEFDYYFISPEGALGLNAKWLHVMRVV